MTTETQTPEDWILFEAAKRSGWDDYTIQVLRETYNYGAAFTALCDMIQKYEKKPVDRKALCAEQAIADWVQTTDDTGQEWIGLRAIQLYEEGFGK